MHLFRKEHLVRNIRLVRKVSSGRSSLPLGQRAALSSLLVAAAFAVVPAARAQTGTYPVYDQRLSRAL